MHHLPFKVGTSTNLNIRGIIADRNIKKGELIEKCPLILSEIKTEERYLKKTVLWKYYYEFNNKYHALVLGFGSLINHSYTPNALYHFDFKNKYIVYKSLTDIKEGEEICVNYNFIPTSQEKLPEELMDYNKHLKVGVKNAKVH